MRTLLDCFTPIPDSQNIQIEVLTENIEWAKKEKRIFLKHNLETRLVGLYVIVQIKLRTSEDFSLIEENRQLETAQYKPALTLIDNLLSELKRLDDKMVLTEVHLLESRVYRAIGNLSKAKVHFFFLQKRVLDLAFDRCICMRI